MTVCEPTTGVGLFVASGLGALALVMATAAGALCVHARRAPAAWSGIVGSGFAVAAVGLAGAGWRVAAIEGPC